MRTAAYFNVGDLVLFGKYKNKKGRIVSFSLDEKGQPTVEIEPVPKGQKQNKTLTLFKIRKMTPEKTASLVALTHLVSGRYAAKVVTRQLGTCGFCGRTIKIPNGLLALHGYKRPGMGYTEGNCPGTGHPPFEVSPVTAELGVSYLQRDISTTKQALNNLSTVTEIPLTSTYMRGRSLKKDQVSEADWGRQLAIWKRSLESDIEKYQGLLAHYEAKVRAWKPQGVREIDEHAIEQSKQERQKGSYAKKLAKYEALKQKTLERLDTTFANLKQLESKYKSKKSDKVRQEIAKKAYIILTIFKDSVYKLWESHPEGDSRGEWKRDDVLKDLDRDTIWKHLGTLHGGTYMPPKDVDPLLQTLYTVKEGWSDRAKEWEPSWPGFH